MISPRLLFLLLVRRHLWSLHSGLRWLGGLTLDTGIRGARRAWGSEAALLNRGCPLQRGLARCGQKAASVAARVIDEHPLIVVVLFVEYPDTLFLTRAGDSNHRSATKDLRPLAWARGCPTRCNCAKNAWRSWPDCGQIATLARSAIGSVLVAILIRLLGIR